MAWMQSLGIKHCIFVAIIRSDSASGMRGRKDKVIMGCEIGGNY